VLSLTGEEAGKDVGLYAYQVVDRTGSPVYGRLEAENEEAVVDRLRQMGYIVVEVGAVTPSIFRVAFRSRRKVAVGDLALFSRQLAAMLGAGIPLTRGLFTLARQITNPALRDAVEDAARNVEGGMSFGDALAAHPHVFPSLYVSMVRAGEVGGTLEEVLNRLAEQLERDKALRDQIRSATFYPTVVVCFAILVLLGMMFFIVPIFMKFFPAGMTLPLPTRIIIAVSNSLRHWWFLWFLGTGATVFGIRAYLRSPAGSRTWDHVKFRLPVFGPLVHRAVIARFCRTFATLLAGGIPVLQALETAGPASGNTLVAEAVSAAGERIQEGKSIAAPLAESGVFPPMVIEMINVGEESGNVPSLLTRVADFYEAEVAALSKGLAAMIEPILIIFVGCLVGVMVISLYLPIFLVVTSVGR
jgi:type IV pilus assembly protein PilC